MKKEDFDKMMKENPERLEEIFSDIHKLPYQLLEISRLCI
jgi:hypothetical protein